MSRDSAKAHYTKQPGDPDEGFITASDAQAAIDDIYDDMSAPAVIAEGSVTSGKIAADAVGSAQIATGAVGSGELATDAVTSDKIADGAVSNAHVASDAAIAASKVAGTAVTQADTGTVTNGMLAGSIAKTKVAGTAITAADTGTVTGTMIAAGAVDNGNLAANAVNEAKIASGAVTTVKIADDAVTSDKIADNAVTAAQIAANAVGASELADNAVDTAAIAADAVTADKIANDTITAAELAANSVGTSELANDSVTAAKILDGTITANEIQNASITGAKLVNDTITSAQIAADAVGSSEIAAGAVGTAEIADAAVTSAKIADGTIVNADINAAAAIDGSKIVGLGNLLTANQASCGATLNTTEGFAGWATGTIVVNAGRLLITAPNASGDAGADTTRFPVTAGDVLTVFASMGNIVGTRNAGVTVSFYTADDSGAWFSGSLAIPETNIPDGDSGYVDLWGTVTVPATATYASLNPFLHSTGSANDRLSVTLLGVWKGAGGVWALPGTPVVGQSHIATNGAFHLSGTGSPEGVVTAAPGSTWLQTDATTDVKGWIRWVKATGTGNTGWVAGPEADTGWRDVTADKINWMTGGSIWIRRVGTTVHVRAGSLKGSATFQNCYDLPTGFQHVAPLGVNGTTSFVAREDYATGAGVWGKQYGSAVIIQGGLMSGAAWSADYQISIGMSFTTTSAWPSVLPGSAA